jgi:hypothetical protein
MGIAMGTVAGSGRKRKRTKLDRELARAPVWNVGEWGAAVWGEAEHASTLAEDLLAAIRVPEGPARAALLEALARQPLLVTPWVAVPEVQRKVSALSRTPEGRRVQDVVVPILCRFVLRLAWDEVAPHPGADLHQVAGELHTRAMMYLVNFLDDVGDDPASIARVAEIPPRERERVLSAMLDLKRWLGPGWRRRRATMLGSTPGALRTWRWRRRTVTRPRRSIRAKSGS